LTPQAKYDTAFTIDERFERHWQPLKGISIKSIFIRIVLPHQYKIYKLKWALKNRSYLGEFEAEFKKALARESGVRGYCLLKKPKVENLVTLSL
jgi:hypothetical protein